MNIILSRAKAYGDYFWICKLIWIQQNSNIKANVCADEADIVEIAKNEYARKG